MDTKKKILLVDGDKNFGHTVSKALNPEKYSYFYANSGSAGIQLAFDHQPELIIYNLALHSIEGFDIFRAFKAFSHTHPSVVLFLSEKANAELNGHSIGLRQNEVIVKPDNMDDFIKSIESRVQEGHLAKDDLADDFNALFELSPYGVFLFTADHVLKANSFLREMIDRGQQFDYLKLEEIFDRSSFQKIRLWIKHYSKNIETAFNEQVVVKDRMGGEYPMHLKVSEFKVEGKSIQFVGFVYQSISEKNVIVSYQLANEVCHMLRRENLAISEPLEKKITQIIKSRTVENSDQNKSFFTKRENEVLRLTMEGLSIKVIADKMAISSRTVEKFRTKLMEKSGAKNIVEVIVFALKNNLVKL